MKTKEEWLNFQKQKKARAEKNLANINVNLSNPEYYYQIYCKQKNQDTKKVENKVIASKVVTEKDENKEEKSNGWFD